MVNILIIFLGAVVVFWFSFMNQTEVEQSLELKEKGFINHTSHVRFIKGLPDFQEGEIVTINVYNDIITVNDNQVIRLENIKQATTFKVRQMMLSNEGVIKKAMLDRFLPNRLGIIICCIMNTKTLTFLSVKFVNQQEQECNGLFCSGNHQNIIRLAKDINKQKDMFLKGHVSA